MFGETPEYQSGLMEVLGYYLERDSVCTDGVGCSSFFFSPLCLSRLFKFLKISPKNELISYFSVIIRVSSGTSNETWNCEEA